jgi:hypothetical protein
METKQCPTCNRHETLKMYSTTRIRCPHCNQKTEWGKWEATEKKMPIIVVLVSSDQGKFFIDRCVQTDTVEDAYRVARQMYVDSGSDELNQDEVQNELEECGHVDIDNEYDDGVFIKICFPELKQEFFG